MQPAPISKAVVIGTGMMGPGIGLVLALGGVATTLVSRTTEGAARGMASVHGASCRALMSNQLVDAETVDAALARISTSASLESAAGDAGLVIESGPEDLRLQADALSSNSIASAQQPRSWPPTHPA